MSAPADRLPAGSSSSSSSSGVAHPPQHQDALGNKNKCPACINSTNAKVAVCVLGLLLGAAALSLALAGVIPNIGSVHAISNIPAFLGTTLGGAFLVGFCLASLYKFYADKKKDDQIKHQMNQFINEHVFIDSNGSYERIDVSQKRIENQAWIQANNWFKDYTATRLNQKTNQQEYVPAAQLEQALSGTEPLAQRIAELERQVAALPGLEGEVATLHTDLAAAQAQLETAQKRVSNLERYNTVVSNRQAPGGGFYYLDMRKEVDFIRLRNGQTITPDGIRLRDGQTITPDGQTITPGHLTQPSSSAAANGGAGAGGKPAPSPADAQPKK